MGRYRNYPVLVSAYTDWVSIAGGFEFFLGVREDGSLWVRGWNSGLTFGCRNHMEWQTLTQIHPYELRASVSAGGTNRAFAVTQDGRLMRLGAASLHEFPSVISS